MDDHFDIILANAPEILDVCDLSSLACVNRQCSVLANTEIQILHKKYIKGLLLECAGKKCRTSSYDKPAICSYCKSSTAIKYAFTTNINVACYECKGKVEVCKTEAKSKYKLTDDDLWSVDFYTSSHFIYKNDITYYSRRQAIMTAILKHGEIPKKRLYSKAKAHRLVQVGKLHEMYGRIANQAVFEYVRNGNGRIRWLTRVFEKVKGINAWLKQIAVPSELVDMDYIVTTVDDLDGYKRRFVKRLAKVTSDADTGCIYHKFTLSEKREYLNKGDMSIVRKYELVNALKSNGLELRDDSQLCKKFIQGETEKTLEEVVIIMLEMKFLYAHTNYGKVMSRLLCEARDLAENHVQYMHGIHNMVQYREMVEEMIDMDAIRARARAIVGFHGL